MKIVNRVFIRNGKYINKKAIFNDISFNATTSIVSRKEFEKNPLMLGFLVKY